MTILDEKLVRLLYVRFCTLFGGKFATASHTEDFQKMWYEDWQIGLAGIETIHIKAAIDHCRINLTWPPCLAEFRQLCEAASGIPSIDHALASAIRGVFDHPIIKLAYDEVGSWAMKNCKADILHNKFSDAYKVALSQYRLNPEVLWAQLENSKAVPLELPEPPKKLSASEVMDFRERMAQWTARAAEEKASIKVGEQPKWDAVDIRRGGKDYEARRKYLIGVSEVSSSGLPLADQYDRIRFLREILGAEQADKFKRLHCHTSKDETPPRASNGSRRPYKEWGHD